MKRLVFAVFVGAAVAAPLPKEFADADAPHREACKRQGMNEAECNGRRIWFNATGGNERFYTYTFPQRVGVTPNWYRVLRTDQRDDRFEAWGIINDPSCCVPGSDRCPAKTREETFGLDWCPGDEELLKHVGRKDNAYVDPACSLKDSPLDKDDPHTRKGTLDQRHSPCDLRFGTSTGALGFRKFPNPRFDAAKWDKLNGGRATWNGFARFMGGPGRPESDARVSKLLDGSVEPPFLIGTSCGSCHIAFDPLNPPDNPARPKWENIKGLVGNQYTRMSEVLGSGLSRNSLEFQMFAHARPGVTDSSAVPNDQVNNPGTITPIINLSQRPVFPGRAIVKWRKASACAPGVAETACWCEPGRDGKCWERSERSDDKTTVRIAGKAIVLDGVHSILKGGEDSIGVLEAMQRVYLNVGSCGEQCWTNHFADYRQLDPSARNYGQTPVNIGQCRRDCPNFRAVEDRLPDVLDYLLSSEADANDLQAARDRARKRKDPGAPAYTKADLVADLERATEFGPAAVARGAGVFARKCAGCHSSVPANRRAADATGPDPDFGALSAAHPRPMREDFMGSDEAKPADVIGTYRCRALHSNHMKGHLYEEYSSASVQRERKEVPKLREPTSGGRGYLRAPSLVNVWATAPYMHNNAIGPEVCGKPAVSGNDFHRARYTDESALAPLGVQPHCVAYDPGVEGRYALFKMSIDELLRPEKRGLKSTFTTEPVFLDLGIRSWDGHVERPIASAQLGIPSNIHAGFLAGFRHKLFALDFQEALGHSAWQAKREGKDYILEMKDIFIDVATGRASEGRAPSIGESLIAAMVKRRDFLRGRYWSCKEDFDNRGHTFGHDLSEADKRALTAFLATL